MFRCRYSLNDPAEGFLLDANEMESRGTESKTDAEKPQFVDVIIPLQVKERIHIINNERTHIHIATHLI